MMQHIVVIDYGLGNIHSVCRAIEHCGGRPILSSDPKVISTAERVLLPGVGAFEDGMKGLRERDLISPILDYVQSCRPLLGVCLGMQMLMDGSDEFGDHLGLGLIPGRVQAIPAFGQDAKPHKVPHIGWNGIHPARGNTWENTVLHGLTPGASMYFVHSYAAVPLHSEHRLADCKYDGQSICAVVGAGNVFGCQFHPEKSGEAGLKILKSFIMMPMHLPK